MTVRWAFYDPLVLETYTFEVNPNDGGSPQRKKNFSYQNTAAPNGKSLMFQGRDDTKTISFSGTLLTQAQYDTFGTWFEKSHQIRLTDDLSRQFWIVITSYAPKRVRAVTHPWKHTYSIDATVVDWP
jgi:hypothetical protein